MSNQDIQIVPSPYSNSSITFTPSGDSEVPMLKIGPDGFWVRGVKIPVDENEGMAVFKAFKQWMVEVELRRSI